MYKGLAGVDDGKKPKALPGLLNYGMKAAVCPPRLCVVVGPPFSGRWESGGCVSMPAARPPVCLAKCVNEYQISAYYRALLFALFLVSFGHSSMHDFTETQKDVVRNKTNKRAEREKKIPPACESGKQNTTKNNKIK